ncbi:MAG TPA: TolC family protein [Chitinophagales bacterium]|nr:TolC family protein [Chitinophagales bacterium]HRK27295.1 TolC family protein [Chitinophagales bacterium]
MMPNLPSFTSFLDTTNLLSPPQRRGEFNVFACFKAFRCFFVFLFTVQLQAQNPPVLTIGDAVQTALANNFNLQINRLTIESAQLNNHPGEAGMLPTVGLQTGTSVLVNNISQKFVNGTEINRAGVLSSNSQFAVNAVWTLFDGFRMSAARQRLRETVTAQEQLLSAQMLQTVRSVTELYLDIVRQQQLLKTADTIIAITNERLLLSKMRFESGLSPKMDYLQAQTDVNTQFAQKLAQLNALQQTKENLNLLMGKNADEPFAITDDAALYANWVLPDSFNANANPNVQLLKTQMNITQLQQQEIEAAKYPQVDLNGAYNFNFNRSQAGFSLYNLSTGPVAGINVTWNLFNGGAVKRAAAQNLIQLQNLKTTVELTEQQLNAQWVQAQRNLAFAQNLAKLENQNMETAAENMAISLERLRAGVANSLELRQAQQSYEQSLVRKTEALFQVKLAEIALLFLQGSLLKEE